MCGIVAKGLQPDSPSGFLPLLLARPPPSASSTTPEIVWRDENFTVYRERAHPVSSRGHLIIVFNLHVPSLYTLSSSDVPLLVSLRALAHRFLTPLASPPSVSPRLSATPSSGAGTVSPLRLSSPDPTAKVNRRASSYPLTTTQDATRDEVRVGFITPPWKDSAIPVKDHLHAHAYLAPADLCGWWRGVAFGPLAWYPVDDLIAEIRESTSNNRVKSGYENRRSAPIDMIPNAGARSGTADGTETTETSLGAMDLESGERTPTSTRSRTPNSSLLTPNSSQPLVQAGWS